jgi:hypothetical protein
MLYRRRLRRSFWGLRSHALVDRDIGVEVFCQLGRALQGAIFGPDFKIDFEICGPGNYGVRSYNFHSVTL